MQIPEVVAVAEVDIAPFRIYSISEVTRVCSKQRFLMEYEGKID